MKNIRCVMCHEDATVIYKGFSLCPTHLHEQLKKSRKVKIETDKNFHSLFELIFGK